MPTVQIHKYTLALTGTSSCLSILGAFLIFYTFFKLPNIRNFTRQLLVYLTIADSLTAVGNLVATVRYAVVHSDFNNVSTNCSNVTQDVDSDLVCTIQSYVTTFSNMASFFWTFVIALHMFLSVFLKTDKSERLLVKLIFHSVSWGIPLILVTIVVVKGYLGEDFCYGTGVWCGIKSNLEPHVITTWMYIVDIGWQVSCYLSTCFLYIFLIFVKFRYKYKHFSAITPRLRNEDKNFLFVWLIIYLLKLWGLTRFFITTYASDEMLRDPSMTSFLEFLLNIQSYGASGQAFWNCILFCFCDSTVRKAMVGWIKGEDGENELLVNSVDGTTYGATNRGMNEGESN